MITTQQIKELYFDKNMTATEVANELGCTKENVYYHAGKLKGIYKLNTTASSNITNIFTTLNPTSEYWIGFLLADGYIKLNRGGRASSVRLRLKDEEHVIKFAEALDFSGAISEENNGSYTVQISNQELVDTLSPYGIVNCKSLSDFVPDELKDSNHFWRGVVEGDGWIHYKQPRGNKIIGLCGGYGVCEGFLHYVSRHLELKYKPILTRKDKKSRNFSRVDVHSIKSVNLILDLLYKDSHSKIRLNRKYELYKGPDKCQNRINI